VEGASKKEKARRLAGLEWIKRQEASAVDVALRTMSRSAAMKKLGASERRLAENAVRDHISTVLAETSRGVRRSELTVQQAGDRMQKAHAKTLEIGTRAVKEASEQRGERSPDDVAKKARGAATEGDKQRMMSMMAQFQRGVAEQGRLRLDIRFPSRTGDEIDRIFSRNTDAKLTESGVQATKR
jgi:hypothetical protein